MRGTIVPAWNFEAVEAAFAEAPFDPSLWVKALDSVTTSTVSYGAVLIPTTGGVLPTLPFTDRMQGSFETYIRDGWHLRDERFRGIQRMMRDGIVDDLDLFDLDTIKKHPYYQEFLAPHGLRWFAGLKIHSGTELWCLSIQRTINQDPFSKEEKLQLVRLSRRLSTCAAMARAFGAMAAASALEAFAMSSTAALLVDRHGKIFEANRAAEQLLTGEIHLKKGRLIGIEPRAATELDVAVRELLARRKGGLSSPVALPRNGRRHLLAYPAKLSSKLANAFADCQAMIVLVDPEADRKPPEATLRSVFHLSEAEARLAGQLGSGDPLETAAERLGIAKETSRSQLKSIFAKTGVNRQAQLVALMSELLDDDRNADVDRKRR
jgi:DNA-binding CsgD family transcriptional regulator